MRPDVIRLAYIYPVRLMMRAAIVSSAVRPPTCPLASMPADKPRDIDLRLFCGVRFMDRARLLAHPGRDTAAYGREAFTLAVIPDEIDFIGYFPCGLY